MANFQCCQPTCHCILKGIFRTVQRTSLPLFGAAVHFELKVMLLLTLTQNKHFKCKKSILHRTNSFQTAHFV